jgi:hypothetical protein
MAKKQKQKQKQRQSVSQRQKVKVIVNLGKAIQQRKAKRQARRKEIQQPAVNQIWTYQPQQLLPATQYQQPMHSQIAFNTSGLTPLGESLGGQAFTNIQEQRENILNQQQPFKERDSQPYSITNELNQRQQPYLLDDVGYEPEGQLIPFQKAPSRGRVEFEDDEPEGQMVLYTPTQQPTQPQNQIIPKSRVDFDDYFDDYFDNLQQTYLFDDPPRGLGVFEIPKQVLDDLFRPKQPLLLLNQEQAEVKPSTKKKKQKSKPPVKEDDEVESGAKQRRKGRPKGSKNKSKEVLLQERLKKQARRDAREQRREESLRQSGYTTDNPQEL